jgi:type I restriction enzyme M protein
VIPGLRDVRSIAAGGHDVLEFEQKLAGGIHTFPASAMSEGSLRALAVVIAAQQVRKGQMLVIEEPEANVHPGVAALVYDVLEEASQRGDVLITTHSPDLLDAAKDETILVCSATEGVTRIGPLDSSQRQLVREGLFRLAELMRAEPLRIEGDEPETVDP